MNHAHSLLEDSSTRETPRRYLQSHGEIFAEFGEKTQDSGNVSFSIRTDYGTFFVKSAGDPHDPKPHFDFEKRVSLLRNAIELNSIVDHPHAPKILNVIESGHGPLLVYPWVKGILLRNHLDRFTDLPTHNIIAVLTQVYDLHLQICNAGYIANDFYDGCMIYDKDENSIHVIDLDHYHMGSFTNTMGRLCGSTRFMAPEEFEMGATIDESTTVYNLARAGFVFLSEGKVDAAIFRGSDQQFEVLSRACQEEKTKRYPRVSEFYQAWRDVDL